MLVIHENDLSIEVSEQLNFDYHVFPIFLELQEEAQYDLEEAEKEEYHKDLNDLKRFAYYQLTKQDKLKILGFIMDNYEFESNDYNVSLFDEDLIRKSIQEWLEQNFDLDLNAF